MHHPIQNAITLPHTQDNEALHKMLQASLRRKGRTGITPVSTTSPFPATLFLLTESTLYQKLSPEQQQQILQSCNDFVLSGAYFIEKAGLSYCAKMILQGETTDIRQMYGLIASDESIHLEWISPYVRPSLRSAPLGKFIPFIAQMVEQYDANTLYFLVQTVLEGWGLAYYKSLATACQLPCLQQTLMNIMKDEAIHHKTGVALFDPARVDLHSRTAIFDGMKAYADILRQGSVDMVDCFEQHIGPLNSVERKQLLEDLQSETTSQFKLNLLKRIMQNNFTAPMIQQMEDEGYFKV